MASTGKKCPKCGSRNTYISNSPGGGFLEKLKLIGRPQLRARRYLICRSCEHVEGPLLF